MKWQLRVIADEEPDLSQGDVDTEDHSVESRTDAETPEKGSAPATDALATYDPSDGIGVHIDGAVRQDDEIGGNYDSTTTKLIITAPGREEVPARAECVLTELGTGRSRTVTPLHHLIFTGEAFREGSRTAKYLDEVLDPNRTQATVGHWSPEAATGGGDDDEITECAFTVKVSSERFGASLEERGAPAVPVGNASADGSNSSGPRKRRDDGDDDS